MNLKNVRLFTLTACLALAAMATPCLSAANIPAASVQQTQRPVTHKVVAGETVYSIARAYNISVADIYKLNPKSVDGIKVGDVLTIPAATASPQSGSTIITYTAKQKETLYSISKRHGLKVDDLINANPELRTTPLKEGQTLRIPQASASTTPQTPTRPAAPTTPTTSPTTPKAQFVSHKVAPKETIYGISRRYNVSTEAIIDFNPDLKNGLREGSTIIIPILEPASSTQTSTLQNTNRVSVGIVLPFMNKSDGQSARFLEYYEGFLLALQEMKTKGLSANMYVFDIGSETGTEKLKSLLDTYEMKYLDLIVGGVSESQIAIISDFARKQGIKYAIPFPTKTNDVEYNQYVFQINAPHSVLYNNVAKTFATSFPNANVIYLTESDSSEDRTDFINALNEALPRAGMIANKVTIDNNTKSKLADLLDASRRNIIIPASASLKTLQKVLPVLSSIRDENSAVQISLFGHTDWQTYTQYKKDFARYDTYIYTPFFLNDTDYRSSQFIATYKKWFNNKNLINTYPKYGVLGYDTGLSFLTALAKYGKNFESNTNSMATSSLQTPFLFKKETSQSGYMNNGFYLVHYKADGTIEKTEYGR